MVLFIRHEGDLSPSLYNVNNFFQKKRLSEGFWNTKVMIWKEDTPNEVKFISTIQQYYTQDTAKIILSNIKK